MESATLNGAGSAVGAAAIATPAGYSIDTTTGGTTYGFQSYQTPYVCPVIRAYGTDLYAAAMVYKAGTGVKILLAKRVSGSWTTSIIQEDTDDAFYGGEIFKISTNFYYACYYGAAGTKIEIYKWDGTEYNDSISSKVTFGQSDGTKFYYYENGYVRSFDGTNFASVEAFGWSSTGSPHHSYLIWQDGLKILGLQQVDYSGAGDLFAFAKQGATTVRVQFDFYLKPNFYYNSVSGQVETKFLIGDDDYLYFLPFARIMALPAQTMCNGGWNGSYDMCTGAYTISKCYTIALASNEDDVTVELNVMKTDTAKWSSQTQPIQNGTEALYDDADTLVTILRHSKGYFDGILWHDNMFSPATKDLQKLVTEDYSDGTWDDHEILDDLLATYCDFIQEGSIAAASAYTNKFNFIRRPLYLCLLDICLFNKRIWCLQQGYLMHYSAGTTDSTINLASTDTDLGVVEKTVIASQKAEIQVTGHMNLAKTVTNDIGTEIWQTHHPSIVDQTTLDTLADNIDAVTDEACTTVKAIRKATTMIDLGELFDLEYNVKPWDLADTPYLNMVVIWQTTGNLWTYLGYSRVMWANWIQDELRNSGQNAQSSTTAHANGTLTHAQLEAALMIGAANYAWVPLIYEESDANSGRSYYGAISNPGTSACSWTYKLPLPTNRGGKKLYVSDLKLTVEAANGTNYVDGVYLYCVDADGDETTVYTGAADNRSAKGEYNYSGSTDVFGTYDLSSYVSVTVMVLTVVANANALKVGALNLKCYYDT
jgi:hypothetical protein